jgi:hypothetical protein
VNARSLKLQAFKLHIDIEVVIMEFSKMSSRNWQSVIVERESDKHSTRPKWQLQKYSIRQI